MAKGPYNFSNNLPANLIQVLGELLKFDIADGPVDRVSLIERCIKPKAKKHNPHMLTAMLQRYFQFLKMYGMVYTSSRRENFLIDRERVQAIIDCLTNSHLVSTLSDTEKAARQVVLERAWQDSRNGSSSADSFEDDSLTETPSTDKSEGDLTETPVDEDEDKPKSSEIKPAPKAKSPPSPAKTHVGFFTDDEYRLIEYVGAWYDQKKMRVGIPPEFDGTLERFVEYSLLSPVAKSRADEPRVCNVMYKPATLTEVKISGRRLVDFSANGQPQNVPSANGATFIQLDDSGISHYCLGEKTQPCLRGFETFEKKSSGSVSDIVLSRPTKIIPTHKVCLTPEEAHLLLMVATGRQRIRVVEISNEKRQVVGVESNNELFTALLGHQNLSELRLLIQAESGTVWKVNCLVAVECLFVEYQPQVSLTRIEKLKKKKEVTDPKHWITTLEALAAKDAPVPEPLKVVVQAEVELPPEAEVVVAETPVKAEVVVEARPLKTIFIVQIGQEDAGLIVRHVNEELAVPIGKLSRRLTDGLQDRGFFPKQGSGKPGISIIRDRAAFFRFRLLEAGNNKKFTETTGTPDENQWLRDLEAIAQQLPEVTTVIKAVVKEAEILPTSTVKIVGVNISKKDARLLVKMGREGLAEGASKMGRGLYNGLKERGFLVTKGKGAGGSSIDREVAATFRFYRERELFRSFSETEGMPPDRNQWLRDLETIADEITASEPVAEQSAVEEVAAHQPLVETPTVEIEPITVEVPTPIELPPETKTMPTNPEDVLFGAIRKAPENTLLSIETSARARIANDTRLIEVIDAERSRRAEVAKKKDELARRKAELVEALAALDREAASLDE